MLEALKLQYKQLGSEIERLEAQPTGVWRPEENEVYWHIDSGVSIVGRDFTASTDDRIREIHHNVYKTEELAKKANVLQRRSNLVIQACLNFDPDFEPDWSDHNQVKYQFYYSYFCDRWRGHNVNTSDWGAACVSTKEKSDLVLEYLNSQEIT
tara:strand:- start:92 stop:550 length:459 start_codon:yes stop_codon:yes gene_type:complete